MGFTPDIGNILWDIQEKHIPNMGEVVKVMHTWCFHSCSFMKGKKQLIWVFRFYATTILLSHANTMHYTHFPWDLTYTVSKNVFNRIIQLMHHCQQSNNYLLQVHFVNNSSVMQHFPIVVLIFTTTASRYIQPLRFLRLSSWRRPSPPCRSLSTVSINWEALQRYACLHTIWKPGKTIIAWEPKQYSVQEVPDNRWWFIFHIKVLCLRLMYDVELWLHKIQSLRTLLSLFVYILNRSFQEGTTGNLPENKRK